MKVKDSPLYKSLCQAVRKQDHAELLRMLEMVEWKESRTWEGLKAVSLWCAFDWTATPQGFGYWETLAQRTNGFHRNNQSPRLPERGDSV